MAATYQLEIITPERTFFRGQVESLIVSTNTGQLGILKGHAPIVAALESGILQLKTEGKWRKAAAAEGFVTVWQDGVSVMTHSVLWPEEVDWSKEQEEKLRAEEAMRQAKSMEEYIRFKVQTARAMARLSLYNDKSLNMD